MAKFGDTTAYETLSGADIAPEDTLGIWDASAGRYKLLTAEGLLDYVHNATVISSPTGADDTAAFVAAAGAGGLIIVQPGTYLVDPIVINQRVTIWIQKGATLRLRASPGEVRTGVLHLSFGATGSLIVNEGVIDGNRAALISDYLALSDEVQSDGSYVKAGVWSGLYIQCGGVTYDGRRGVIVNTMSDALRHQSVAGDFRYWLRCEDCTFVAAIIQTSGTEDQIDDSRNSVVWVRAKNIGNQVNNVPIPYWQHAFFASNTAGTYDVVLENYAPLIKDDLGVDIGDPFPNGIQFQTCRDLTIQRAIARGYVWDAGDSRTTVQATALFLTACKDSVVHEVSSIGYSQGCQDASCDNVNIHLGVIDCRGGGPLVSRPAVWSNRGGIYGFITGDSITDPFAQAGGRGTRYFGGVIIRPNVGLRISSSHGGARDVRVVGAIEQGFQIRRSVTAQVPSHVDLDGCEAVACGQSGLQINHGSDVRVRGFRAVNNGQNTGVGNDFRSGIFVTEETSGETTRVILDGVIAIDDQTFTLTDAISFVPGATDADDRKTLFVNRGYAARLSIGQRVTIANATGSGSATGTVVDMLGDQVVLEHAAPVTYSETGNTVSGTGTLSSVGVEVTGVGTSFTTELEIPVVIVADGEYRVVTKVVDDTHLQISEPFTSPLSGDSFSILTDDLTGIPSQTRPITGAASVTGPVVLTGSGSIGSGHTMTDSPVIAAGESFYIGGQGLHSQVFDIAYNQRLGGVITTTTAALGAIGDAINTIDKFSGKVVFATDVKHEYRAAAAGASSVWVHMAGGTDITPA